VQRSLQPAEQASQLGAAAGHQFTELVRTISEKDEDVMMYMDFIILEPRNELINAKKTIRSQSCNLCNCEKKA